MATQHIDTNKVSLVEMFPYLHRDGSGEFKQDLLSWLMENISEFAKLVHTWVATCVQLEREGAAGAWAAQNGDAPEPRSVIYVGGVEAAKVMENIYGSVPLSLAGIGVALRQTRNGMVLYVQDHPSYWMMKGAEAAAFERFRATMDTWPALTTSIRHGANFQQLLGASGRMQDAQEAATRSAIERYKLDVTQVLAWCKSGLHTGVADTIDWAADFAQRHCDGDPGVTIRLGFSEHVRHMSPAERQRLEGRAVDAARFRKAMGRD